MLANVPVSTFVPWSTFLLGFLVIAHLFCARGRRYLLADVFAWLDGFAWLASQAGIIIRGLAKGIYWGSPELDDWFVGRVFFVVSEFPKGLNAHKAGLRAALGVN